MVNSTDNASQFQKEVQLQWERFQTLMDAFVVNPADPAAEVTPFEVIWKRENTRLLRYGSRERETLGLPYLIVPWLGISRTYVLDLLPGSSMIEYLANHGHDVYLLD